MRGLPRPPPPAAPAVAGGENSKSTARFEKHCSLWEAGRLPVAASQWPGPEQGLRRSRSGTGWSHSVRGTPNRSGNFGGSPTLDLGYRQSFWLDFLLIFLRGWGFSIPTRKEVPLCSSSRRASYPFYFRATDGLRGLRIRPFSRGRASTPRDSRCVCRLWSGVLKAPLWFPSKRAPARGQPRTGSGGDSPPGEDGCLGPRPWAWAPGWTWMPRESHPRREVGGPSRVVRTPSIA